MLQIISATNRPNSHTNLVARSIQKLLPENISSNVLSLQDLNNSDLITESMFSKNRPSDIISEWQQKHLIPSSHWIIIAPEYNGSFPGILKLFLDVLSVKQAKETFHGKKLVW